MYFIYSKSHYTDYFLNFSSVKLLSCIQLFMTPWTTARKISMSIINSPSLLKFMFIELVMTSNHLILCRPLLLLLSIFPSIRVFSSESLFASGGQNIGSAYSQIPALALADVPF